MPPTRKLNFPSKSLRMIPSSDQSRFLLLDLSKSRGVVPQILLPPNEPTPAKSVSEVHS